MSKVDEQTQKGSEYVKRLETLKKKALDRVKSQTKKTPSTANKSAASVQCVGIAAKSLLKRHRDAGENVNWKTHSASDKFPKNFLIPVSMAGIENVENSQTYITCREILDKAIENPSYLADLTKEAEDYLKILERGDYIDADPDEFIKEAYRDVNDTITGIKDMLKFAGTPSAEFISQAKRLLLVVPAETLSGKSRTHFTFNPDIEVIKALAVGSIETEWGSAYLDELWKIQQKSRPFASPKLERYFKPAEYKQLAKVIPESAKLIELRGQIPY